MQSNSPPPLACKKNSFANFVFQSGNKKYKRDLRSESFVDPAKKSPKKNNFTQTSFRSKTHINLKSPKKVEVFRENSTQTSKTVVAMVQTELDLRLSPDSLSPRRSPNRKSPVIVDDDMIDLMESVLAVQEYESLTYNRKNHVVQSIDTCEEFHKKKLLSGNTLTKAFLARVRNRKGYSPRKPQLDRSISPKAKRSPCASPELRSQSYIENSQEPFFINEEKVKDIQRPRFAVKNITEKVSMGDDRTKLVKQYTNPMNTPVKSRRSTSFMSPTFSSEQKDKSIELKHIEKLISPTKRGRSLSPKKSVTNLIEQTSKDVPYIDKSEHTIKDVNHAVQTERTVCKYKPRYTDKPIEDLHLNLTLSFDNMTNTTASITSSTSTECVLFQAITKLKDQNWSTALRGLAEIVEICRVLDNEVIFPHMTVINQRLIELMRSARSHVSRTACQAVGNLFEYVKDTRRPEFDELVDTLLQKTADSNKFIRHDANLALDCMVTHVATYHAIRAICCKGPEHKNPLVRTATARLIVCAVVIAGPDNILHPHNNEFTRKRIIISMVKFLDDKCHETRKFGQRLYKLLHKDRIFDIYLKRYLERDVILKIKKCLKSPS
ncbi:hypothetical protein NQ315_015448 [Exocentrus adspersus]|uniref:TOG domain-containing protein n=1 Tax=Exocentrus adspersus TaxID=1586481 RepID=A0AAV8VM28_9CUCU|nr:hypothetical protein NQ315_015448 [Exocentrus adspersus]